MPPFRIGKDQISSRLKRDVGQPILTSKAVVARSGPNILLRHAPRRSGFDSAMHAEERANRDAGILHRSGAARANAAPPQTAMKRKLTTTSALRLAKRSA
jgi:hypothetical protein